jgi:hypothetical protein
MIRWIAALCALSAAAALSMAPAISADGVDRTAARRFLRDLQRAIAQVDKRAVASLAAYPIRVMVGGLDVPILNAAELVRLFDVVFTPDMRCAIADARIDDADPPRARVPVTIAGDEISIGSGMISVRSSGAALKIVRITVRQSTVVPPSRPRPRRISFVPKGGLWRELFSGRLANDGTDSYLLSAKVGQVLDIIIQGFRGRDAVLRVLDHKSGRPLVAPPHGPRTWTATLPATGEYRIEVARVAPYCDPPFTYSLDVVLR